MFKVDCSEFLSLLWSFQAIFKYKFIRTLSLFKHWSVNASLEARFLCCIYDLNWLAVPFITVSVHPYHMFSPQNFNASSFPRFPLQSRPQLDFGQYFFSSDFIRGSFFTRNSIAGVVEAIDFPRSKNSIWTKFPMLNRKCAFFLVTKPGTRSRSLFRAASQNGELWVCESYGITCPQSTCLSRPAWIL